MSTVPTSPVRMRRAGSEWTTAEVAILRDAYAAGGSDAVVLRLPERSRHAIRGKANSLGIKCKHSQMLGRSLAKRYEIRADIDAAIREGYIHATRKGDIVALAGRLGRPAWWVQKRATSLGVTRNNRTRLDCWTHEEVEIIKEWADGQLRLICAKLKAAGYKRTPTAVQSKLSRMKIDRENPDRWSATEVAPMLGVNPSTVADWVKRRGLPANRVGEGDSGAMLIERRSLAGWVKRAGRDYVDLRRVDQAWFWDLISGVAA